MTNINRLLSLCSAACCLALGPLAYAQPATEDIIVRLKPGQSIGAINASYNTSTLRGMPSRRTFLLRIPPTAAAPAVENLLRNDQRVAWAERNHILANEGGTQNFFPPTTFGMYEEQYATQLIQADQGQSGPGRMAVAPPIVAVLDTGLDPHHDLIVGRIAPGGFNYVDNNADFSDVCNGNVEGSCRMTGHGTMVAGIILRVAPDAHILPMRVLDSQGIGTSYFIAQAIYDAIDSGASVINLSLGTIHPSQAVSQAVQAAHASGVVVVAMAGNNDQAAPRFYPAAFDSVIAVAGTDEGDTKSWFSDFGTHIDISAPAEDVVGTFPGNRYAYSSGNSFATALVSGAVARIRAARPDFTPGDVRERLRFTADDTDAQNPEFIGLLGTGRINVLRAESEELQAVEPVSFEMAAPSPR